jgi:uncharacterized protein YukE
MGEMTVELADLRAWAAQVERAAQAVSGIGGEATGTIADGDFGKILELITDDYESMLPTFHALLPEEGERLDRTADALREVARDLRDTDTRVAESFGGTGWVHDDHHASGFDDVVDAGPRCPYVPARELPHVNFGFPFDPACDLASSIGLPDPRDYVTQWIVGDVAKAGSHAAYWELYSDLVAGVGTNLEHGQASIDRTWTGRAASSAGAEVAAWTAALSDQSEAMATMAAHVRDMVEQALDMAQLVVDTVKFFISTVAAGWSNAWIPIYGQVKLVDKVRDAFHLINDARKVISVFWSFLMVLKDAFNLAVDAFTTTGLPQSPRLPAG